MTKDLELEHSVGSIVVLASIDRKRVGIIIPDEHGEFIIDLTEDQAQRIALALMKAIDEISGKAEVIL